MPNNITNILKIEWTKEQVEKFIEDVRSDKMIFDFEKIIQMPDHIYRWNLWKAEEEKYWKENCWYDRCLKNRWTKWNAYWIYRNKYTDLPYDDPDENWVRTHKMTYVFDTARATPEPIRNVIMNKYKDLTIKVKYADEDIGHNCWVIKAKDWTIKKYDKTWDTKRCRKVKEQSKWNRVDSLITKREDDKW